MPVPAQDRPLSSVREETIDRLIVNYGHGKLSLEAFERRLDQAIDAKSADALVALTSDLELQVDRQYAQQKRAEFGIRTEPVPYAGDTGWMVHIFSGGNRRGAWTVPREINVINIFGGAEIDFSEARFTSPVTHIKVLMLFGGATFYVNENINTQAQAICLFGGLDNRGPSNPDPSMPTVIVEGLVLFGGVGIKIKRTLKERWLAFADQFKQAFGPLHHNYTNQP
jgi:hypothetical protein